MILPVVIFMVIVAIAVTTLVVLAHRPEEKPVIKLLRQHAYYTAKAAKASRRGHDGVMNVYQEAAADLWKQFEASRSLEEPPIRITSAPGDARIIHPNRPEVYGRPQIPAHLLERSRAARAKTADRTLHETWQEEKDS